jgi:hypothetical protein
MIARRTHRRRNERGKNAARRGGNSGIAPLVDAVTSPKLDRGRRHRRELAMTADRNRPERPRVEPEIIPPDRWRQDGWHPYAYGGGTQRVFVGRLGPLGIGLLILALGVIVAVVLLAVVGAILLWLPLVALILLVAVFSGLRRRRWL